MSMNGSGRKAKKAGGIAATAVFAAAMLFFNAPFMLESAGNLPFDSFIRPYAISLLEPASKISRLLRLDAIRKKTGELREKYMEREIG